MQYNIVNFEQGVLISILIEKANGSVEKLDFDLIIKCLEDSFKHLSLNNKSKSKLNAIKKLKNELVLDSISKTELNRFKAKKLFLSFKTLFTEIKLNKLNKLIKFNLLTNNDNNHLSIFTSNIIGNNSSEKPNN